LLPVSTSPGLAGSLRSPCNAEEVSIRVLTSFVEQWFWVEYTRPVGIVVDLKSCYPCHDPGRLQASRGFLMAGQNEYYPSRAGEGSTWLAYYAGALAG
jgi:hypothetical protein